MDGRLQDYGEVVGPEVIDELHVIAERVHHLSLQNINSTAVGGGVAEILTRMVPLLRELGVQTSWDIIKGDQAFFNVTKAFHNALHGARNEIQHEMFEIFRAATAMNLREMPITGDIVLVHDPQPAGLIDAKDADGKRWVWRCHIDVSTPNDSVWGFLRSYVERYDASVFSMPDFAQELPIPQYMIPPSIDPLSDKNKELPSSEIQRVLQQHGVDPARAILTQVSRFDRLKDPLGVITSYRLVKRKYDCQLIIAGGGASDDPEGLEVLREVQEASEEDPDIHILLLPPFSDLEINAIVRGSTIVFQKSIREGFGLTVSEALWKKKPVIGGATGGIKLQIIDGVNGFLVHSPEGAATRAQQLLSDPTMRRAMGENGHEYVRQNFLVTRHVKDYLLTMLALDYANSDMIHL